MGYNYTYFNRRREAASARVPRRISGSRAVGVEGAARFARFCRTRKRGGGLEQAGGGWGGGGGGGEKLGFSHPPQLGTGT